MNELNGTGVRRRRGSVGRWVAAGVAALLTVPLAALPAGAQTSDDDSSTPPARVTAGDADGRVTVRILHSSDGGSQLLPDADAGLPGVGRFVAAVRELQAAAAGPVVTLSAGDNLMASPVLDASADREGPLYDSVALSGVFDAMILGNRDFDPGPGTTARFIEGFDPSVPFLAANLDVSAEPALAALVERGLIAPATVISTGGERIGVIGALTPQLSSIAGDGDVAADAALAAVRVAVDRLSADGVDKIILISHMHSIGEQAALVGGLSGVDVIVAAGLDDLHGGPSDSCASRGAVPLPPYAVWADDIDGSRVPLVSAPGGYRCVGLLEVTFDPDGEVIAAAGASVEVALDCAPDASVQSAVIEPLTMALADSGTADDVTTAGPAGGACQDRAPALSPADLAPDPDYRLYTVKPGDTLTRIAAAQLGDSSLWRVIFEANRGREQTYRGAFTNSNLIRSGWVLRIPLTI